MDSLTELSQMGFFKPLFVLAIIWELAWKGIALWRAAKNGHLIWYIAVLIVNSVGILPIIYILAFSKPKNTSQPPVPQQ